MYPDLIQPNMILELTSVAPNSSGLRVGAAVTLSDMQQALKNEIESQPGKAIKSQPGKAIESQPGKAVESQPGKATSF